MTGGAEPTSGFVGRTPERALLRAAVDEARRGALQLVVVEGEAGIGKSRLLAEARRHAHAAGMHSWYGAADELERHRPLRAVVDALGPLPAPAEPPAPTGDAFGGAPDRTFLAVEAAVDRIERIAADRPALLGLEDLHWADPATLLVVRAVIRRLSDLPLLIAVTLRPAPRSPELTRLLAVLPALATRHLALAPLDEPAIAELAGQVTAGTPAPRLLAEIRSAGGNPLYVIEMLRALAAEGRMSVVDGVADLAEDAGGRVIPESLRRTLQRRMDTLAGPTLDLLRLAAVLGATFPPAELAGLAGQQVAALLPALQEAVDAGVLEEAGDRLAFRHELLREALYAGIPAGIRTALHRDVGHALAAAGAAAERVAVHLSLGAQASDREAVHWLRRAARQAAPGAPPAAADLLGRAAELCAPDDPERDVLLAELATALTVAGRSADAVTVARGVLDRPHDPKVEAVTRLALAQGLWSQGLLHEWLEQIAYGSQTSALTAAERARFHAETAGGHLTFGRLPAAEDSARVAIAGGRAAGDDLTVCLGLSALSIAAHYRGEFARSIELAAEVVELARRSAQQELGRRFFYAYHGAFLAVADRPDEAAGVLASGRALCAELGVVSDLPPYHYVAAQLHYLAGRWEEAVAEAETCVTVAQEIDTRSAVVASAALLALVAMHRGTLTAAEQHVALARRTLRESGPQWGGDLMLWAEALVQEAWGRRAEALATLAAGWRRHTARDLDHATLRLGPDLVRLLLAADRDPAGAGGRSALGGPAGAAASVQVDGTSIADGPVEPDLPALAAVVARVTEVADRAGTPSAKAAALRCQGLASGDTDLLLAAAAEYDRAGQVLHRALALEDAAVALAACGRGPEAAARFAEALATYDQLGAARDVARVAAAQRAAGIRRGVRGARRRPASGWASLTTTELQVARLAAEGLTNPQIAQRLYISRYTVETHLKHVFAKLSLTSRVQLAAEVARRAG